jgi:hypothetical protein
VLPPSQGRTVEHPQNLAASGAADAAFPATRRPLRARSPLQNAMHRGGQLQNTLDGITEALAEALSSQKQLTARIPDPNPQLDMKVFDELPWFVNAPSNKVRPGEPRGVLTCTGAGLAAPAAALATRATSCLQHPLIPLRGHC